MSLYNWKTPPGYSVSMMPGGFWVVFGPSGGAEFWSRDDEEITDYLEGLAND